MDLAEVDQDDEGDPCEDVGLEGWVWSKRKEEDDEDTEPPGVVGEEPGSGEDEVVAREEGEDHGEGEPAVFFGEGDREDRDDEECINRCDDAENGVGCAEFCGDSEDGVVSRRCCRGVVGVVRGGELGGETVDGGGVEELLG